MEDDPTRMCELIVGLGDVEVLGVDDERAGPLRLHVRRRVERSPCSGCGGLLWSDGEQLTVLVDLPALGRVVLLVHGRVSSGAVLGWFHDDACGGGSVCG